MAAQGDQPVSVDNLAAAINGAAMVETIFTGASKSASVPNAADYALLFVGTGVKNTGVGTSGIASDRRTKHVFVLVPGHLEGTEIKSGSGDGIGCYLEGDKVTASGDQYNSVVACVLGIRAGGGQLIADLLAAIGGEAA